jgi:hypothetical protein
MIEVICAGSLFLSINTCLDNQVPDLALINHPQSTIVQSNILLADSEAESAYRRDLEQLMDRFNIIIQDSDADDEDNSDRDAYERRRELESEEQDNSSDSGDEHQSDYRREAEEARDNHNIIIQDSDTDDEDSSDRDAYERRQELEAEHQDNDSDEDDESGDVYQSDYRRQAEEARDGHNIDVPEVDDEDSSDRDAYERRRELESQ